jgi:mannose-1-phosphate guanylyltransferase
MAYYALILAGGGGTRLWPLSRRERSKPMLALVERRTMFQISVERLLPLFDYDHIYIITGENQVEGLRGQVPEIPDENYIVEPDRRDTGPATGLGTLYIAARDPDAVIAVLTSDHYIHDTKKFRDILCAARQMAERNHIVTLGIQPSFASSSFAYLRRGTWLDEVNGFPCYQVAGIHEKPATARAAEFIMAGNYSWNSGMLIWRANVAMDAFRRHQPELSEIFDKIAPTVGTPNYEAALRRWFPAAPKLSIDQAIMEKADNMVTLTADIGWSDVGTWTTLYNLLRRGKSHEENVIHENTPRAIPVRTTGTFILSERLVVTIGVDDLVIIDTGDVILVCRRDQSEDVRKVVEMLREWGLDEYL